MHVFPGGAVDEADSLSHWKKAFAANGSSTWKGYKDEADWKNRIASIRELFEETNVLLCTSKASFTHKLLTEEQKKAEHWFSDYCVKNGVTPDVDSLLPFARWIAPEALKARFDTSFYLAPIEESQLAHIETNPGEIDHLDWLSPQEALSAYASGQIKLAPPTYFKLTEMNKVTEFSVLMNPPLKEMPPPILPLLLPADISAGSPVTIVFPGDTDHPSTLGSGEKRRVENPGVKQRFIETSAGQPILSNILGYNHPMQAPAKL